MISDIPQGTTLICNRCGAKFTTYYYQFGYINHNNNTSDWNLQVAVNRGNLDEKISEMNEVDKKCALIWKAKNV